ncbi:hypothetical protein Nepgr_032699 [Nepenthes gracilis]|uniref:Uncharacterized protein n=1 Tax=Nepenthes gracilis TaxID=150966 RepID=A0AAD3Y8H9_NEPGR|nr:hypothetical protein Nepgr_032699 [Nepenthes gracilis]
MLAMPAIVVTMVMLMGSTLIVAVPRTIAVIQSWRNQTYSDPSELDSACTWDNMLFGWRLSSTSPKEADR